MKTAPSNRKAISSILHDTFDSLSVGETCSWYGTKYQGTGKDAMLLPCGEPTVGAGLFCDPGHIQCSYHSLCERHKQPVNDWS